MPSFTRDTMESFFVFPFFYELAYEWLLLLMLVFLFINIPTDDK